MLSQTVLLALLVAIAEARFGQEQGNGAIAAIGALGNLGTGGQAATLSGGSIQFLLGAANPCGKLTQADLIISQLGTSAEAVAAARGLVAAEQNFNPFAVSIPSVCSDPTLPKSPELRGVVPLIDPAVGGQDIENANSKKSVTTPFSAAGMSVAQVMIAQGFSNFTAVDVAGKKVAASALAGATNGANGNTPPPPPPAGNATANSTAIASSDCGPATKFVTVTRAPAATSSNCSPQVTVTVVVPAVATTPANSSAVAAPATTGATAAAGKCTGSGQTMVCSAPAVGARKVSDPVTGTFTGFQASTIAGLDFGLCVPTMKFELGLNGRSATAGTFQAQDPLCNKGQQEALNPAIITNRIKDQMTNACGANKAAKDAIAAAQTMIVALGTRDASTAETFNTALGFAGVNINPDNAPQTGLVGHV
ncbi:related to circumsporozoite protein precursor [Rhynchosporium secalis]|uniref:Related to circumsporozoite protein n=1 Tax=Rhynchosporium secalis TaxID=38038 RepID=A0A1E1LWF8_RHYSE|nr:related to circumsporozoite protein precursor [Rhynchosporium secalis]